MNVRRLIERLNALLSRIPEALLLLFTRIAVGHVFWASGRTKVEGWGLSPSAVDLFRNEYKVPIIPPETAAIMAATMEHLLPLILLLGFGTRFAALGLFGMTLVIQIFVYPDAWWLHAMWLAALAWIIAKGGGALSLDHLLARRIR
ncbi:MAG: DoxX family protein [Sphingopyxis sp.]